jgi:hypothetical protein
MGSMKVVDEDIGCEVCGNHGNECFEVYLGKEKHVFDSFDCAMNGMLPKCIYCRCQIIGPGVQLNDVLFCSFECANDCHIRDFENYVIMQQQSQL